MTIPRDTPVGKAIFEVEAELLKGAFKLYPKLKAFYDVRGENKEGMFEYGHCLKGVKYLLPNLPNALLRLPLYFFASQLSLMSRLLWRANRTPRLRRTSSLTGSKKLQTRLIPAS